jgi:hypothetical protein
MARFTSRIEEGVFTTESSIRNRGIGARSSEGHFCFNRHSRYVHVLTFASRPRSVGCYHANPLHWRIPGEEVHKYAESQLLTICLPRIRGFP